MPIAWQLPTMRIFGTTGGPVSVIVFALGNATDGTGGADHMGCDYINGAAIEVDASFGNSARVSALFEAELSECSMNGNLCGESTGEALSRWCATVVSNNALSDFATAPQWAQDGEPDFVNKTDPTDQNADSTGCGMAFLSWLMSQGHTLDKIAPAMVALGDCRNIGPALCQANVGRGFQCVAEISEARFRRCRTASAVTIPLVAQPAQIASERAAKPPAGAAKADSPTVGLSAKIQTIAATK